MRGLRVGSKPGRMTLSSCHGARCLRSSWRPREGNNCGFDLLASLLLGCGESILAFQVLEFGQQCLQRIPDLKRLQSPHKPGVRRPEALATVDEPVELHLHIS